MTEARAGRFDVDIIDTNGPEMETLHREKLLQEVKSPYLADLIPQAILPHREWIGSRLNIFTAAYNTKLVKKDDLPKTYEDLLNPKWKGKLGIEAEDFDWFSGVIGELGEAERPQAVPRHRRRQRHVGAQGAHPAHQPGRVRRGAAGADGLQLQGRAAQEQGRADRLVRDSRRPSPGRTAIGMLRRAPHPHAAVLFFDFMLSDAQELLLKRDFIPTSKKIKTQLNQMPIKFIDPKVILDEEAKWNKLYQDIIVKQSK